MDLSIRGSRAEGPFFRRPEGLACRRPVSRTWRDLHASRASSARGPVFAGLSPWRVLLLLLCVAALATGVMATDYTWTGNGNEVYDDDYYSDAACWTPDTSPGWPNCCTHAALVSDVISGSQETQIQLTASGLSGVGIEQLTVNDGANDHNGQTVNFHDANGSDPVLKCEVYIVDATGAAYDVTVRVTDEALVQTMPTCICSSP